VAATHNATAYWVADGRGFDQACRGDRSRVRRRHGCELAGPPYRPLDNATPPKPVWLISSDAATSSSPTCPPGGGTRHARCAKILTEALYRPRPRRWRANAVVADLARAGRDARRRRSSHNGETRKARCATPVPPRETHSFSLTHAPGTDATNWRRSKQSGSGRRTLATASPRSAVVVATGPGVEPSGPTQGPHDERARGPHLSRECDAIDLLGRRRPCATTAGGPFLRSSSELAGCSGSTFTELREVAPRYPRDV